MSWDQARFLCDFKFGGLLATPTSYREFAFLANMHMIQAAGEATWLGGVRAVGAPLSEFEWKPLRAGEGTGRTLPPLPLSPSVRVNDYYAPWAQWTPTTTAGGTSTVTQPSVATSVQACLTMGSFQAMSTSFVYSCCIDCPQVPNLVFSPLSSNASAVCNGFNSGLNTQAGGCSGSLVSGTSVCGFVPNYGYLNQPTSPSHSVTKVIPCPGRTGNDGPPTVAQGCPFLPWLYLIDIPCAPTTSNIPGYICKSCPTYNGVAWVKPVNGYWGIVNATST